MPKTFSAYTVLVSPSDKEENILGSFFAEGDVSLSNFLPTAGDASMKVVSILKSRTVMESVIDEFDLIKLYNCNVMEEAVENLQDNISIDVEEEGSIRITAFVSTSWFHRDSEEILARKLSADIANYFIYQLDHINKKLIIEQASFQRQFIEERHKETIINLKKSEDSLRLFQEKHNIVSLEEQTNAAILIAADINEQILIKKVHLEIKQNTLDSEHHEIILLQNEITSLQKQLDKMEYRSSNERTKSNSKLFPPFSDVPAIAIQIFSVV